MPALLVVSLYEHQEAGAQWLAAHASGYLADTMGLGKTRTLLRAIQLVRAKRPVVICPAIVRSHWRREADEMGVPLLRVMSYEEAVAGGTALHRGLDPDALIPDEAHYCKSMDALRTRRVFGIGGYARSVRHLFPASGTPMPKNPMELWPALSNFPDVCKEFKLLNHRVYRDRYCVVRMLHMRGRHIERVMPELRNEAEFAELLGKFMLRRLPADVGIDFPTLDWQITELDLAGIPDLSPGAAAALEDNTAGAASGAEIAAWRHALGEAKAGAVVDLLAQQLAASTEKVVVFAHHRDVLAKLAEGLAPFGVAVIHGDVPPKERDLAIRRFQLDSDCRVFIGQNVACQTGITLTAARRVVLVEPDYTAAVNRQLGRRIARIGQTAQHCIAQIVVAAGTLDERILRRNRQEIVLAEKAGLTDAA